MAVDSTGLVQVIAAIGAVIVLIMNTWATVQTKQQVGVLQEKTDAVADDQNKQLSTIHENGNAHLALMTQKLTESEQRNERLLAESNKRIEETSRAAIDRIAKLEALLLQQTQAPTSPAEPVKVTIDQPAEEPVPVVTRRPQAG